MKTVKGGGEEQHRKSAEEDEDVSLLDGEAFRALYPREYLARFVKEGVRPDGRELGAARSVEVVGGAASASDGSAMVRIGGTVVIAAVRLIVKQLEWNERDSEEGELIVGLDVPPLATGKSGRANVDSVAMSQRLADVINADVVDLTQLCIKKGCFVWVALLDVYCLDHSGSVFDAALVAAVAALRAVDIPSVRVSDDGRTCERIDGALSTAAEGMEAHTAGENDEAKGVILRPHTRLSLRRVPLSLTCGVFDGVFLADPTAEEEELIDSTITIAVDEKGHVLGISKPGGLFALNRENLRMLVEAAKMRHAEIVGLIPP